MARMRFEILLSPQAVTDLRALKANIRTAVKEALETHLRNEPTKTSRSRIKRLRGLSKPQYRLRVEEVRVFYDVVGSTVEVLAIVPKPEAESWLNQFGKPE
jgi:mRNA interferase RelE/StbE